jgi:hypothetical protein
MVLVQMILMFACLLAGPVIPAHQGHIAAASHAPTVTVLGLKPRVSAAHCCWGVCMGGSENVRRHAQHPVLTAGTLEQTSQLYQLS